MSFRKYFQIYFVRLSIKISKEEDNQDKMNSICFRLFKREIFHSLNEIERFTSLAPPNIKCCV